MTTIRYWTSWHQNSPAPMNAEFRKKLKRRKKSIEEDSNMAKFAWKIERWWSKDRCITPADTRQWWNFEKKYFVLRRWKRNYWGCLPRGGLVAVVLTNRIFRATVHNVLFAQFEFLPTNPTLANICQKKHILTNRIFRARVSTVVKMCRQYKVFCLSFSR